MHSQQTAPIYPVEKTPLLFSPPPPTLSQSPYLPTSSSSSLHRLTRRGHPRAFSIHDWEARACLTLERLIMRQLHGRADGWIDGWAREWFRDRGRDRERSRRGGEGLTTD